MPRGLVGATGRTGGAPGGRRHEAGRDGPVKAFLPWLLVLAVVIALNALKLRSLGTAVAIAWLGYCVWTWVRPRRSGRQDG